MALYSYLLPFSLFVSAQENQAFKTTSIVASFNENPSSYSESLAQLNDEYRQAKGLVGSRFATYQIKTPNKSPFELYDAEGVFTSPTDQQDFSHRLELRIKPGEILDFERLSQDKSIEFTVEARAKSLADIHRLVHSSELEDAIEILESLESPTSLLFQISVEDFDEPPAIQDAFLPTANQNRGWILRREESGRVTSLQLTTIFNDPEGRTLYAKPGAEDIELREFSGRSPEYGSINRHVGDTNADSNLLALNNPETDGRIVNVTTDNDRIYITPVASNQDGIRRVEIYVRGWDERGPTAAIPRLDPATGLSPAKITVYLQRGTNNPPRWPGGAKGYRATAREGQIGSVTPEFGAWSAIDPEGGSVTHHLIGNSDVNTCVGSSQIKGVRFAGACFAMDSDGTAVTVAGTVDYETVKDDPVGRFTLVATDSLGAQADVNFYIEVLDVDEPITGGFKWQAVSIHLPTQSTRSIDLSELFRDPEQKEVVTYEASSNRPTVVSVNESPEPIMNLVAHDLGTATIRVWARGQTSSEFSTLSVVVKNTNTPPSFVNNVDSYAASVLENIPVGTKLDLVIEALDADRSDVLSFSLNENNNFELTQEGLEANQVQLVTKTSIDYESNHFYLLTLTVSDGVDVKTANVRVLVSNVDEGLTVSSDALNPVQLYPGTSTKVSLQGHFIDEDGNYPEISLLGYDSRIVTVTLTDGNLVTVVGEEPGSTEIYVIAKDSSGSTASKKFTAIVQPSQPPSVARQIPDQSMSVGLLELNIDMLFNDQDSDFTITQATSSNEDVLWVIQPKDEPDVLVLYAWMNGESLVTLTATDTTGLQTMFTFSVTVTTDDDAEEDNTDDSVPSPQLISDQAVGLNQTLGIISLLSAYSASPSEPTGYSIQSSQPMIVAASLASMEVADWWESLSCEEKVLIVEDSGVADETNPYCTTWRVLSSSRKIIVRAVANHYLTLKGLEQGTTKITVVASFTDQEDIKTSFNASVFTTVASSIAPRNPRTYGVRAGESIQIPLDFSVGELDGISRSFRSISQNQSIAMTKLDTEAMGLHVHGINVGTTNVAVVDPRPTSRVTAKRYLIHVLPRPPDVINDVSELHMELGDAPLLIRLSTVFSSPSSLQYAVAIEDPDTVSYTLDGANLHLHPIKRGSTRMRLTASDYLGESAKADLNITVSDTRLHESAQRALSGYSRSLLSSASTVFSSQLSKPIGSNDLSDSRSMPSPEDTIQTHSQPIDGPRTPGRKSSFSVEALPHPQSPATSLTDLLPTLGLSVETERFNRKLRLNIWSDTDTQSYRDKRAEGSLRSNYVGADITINRSIQSGIAFSQHDSTGTFGYGTVDRAYRNKQTMIWPYIRFQPSASISSYWGTFGFGKGKMRVAESNGSIELMDLDSKLAIFGGNKGILELGSLNLSWVGDLALMDTLAAPQDQGEASLHSQVHRVALGWSSNFSKQLSESLRVEPFGEFKLRIDGGTEDSNSGLEVIAGSKLGVEKFQFEVRGRLFRSQTDSYYQERGWSLIASYNEGLSQSGLSFNIAPSWGHAQASFDPFRQSSSSLYAPRDWLMQETDELSFRLNGYISYGIEQTSGTVLATPYLRTQTGEHSVHKVGIRFQGTSQANKGVSIDWNISKHFHFSDSEFGTTISLSLIN